MNRVSSHQCRPKVNRSKCDNNRSNEDRLLEACQGSGASYDFDIHKLYHNVIESLADRDRIIESLRKQLASKEQTIATLEERLVEMSLELASSKALQDEMQLKRRTSEHLDEECHHRTPTPKLQPIKSYVPISITRRTNARHTNPARSQSWHNDNGGGMPVGVKRKVLQLSTLRTSWGNYRSPTENSMGRRNDIAKESVLASGHLHRNDSIACNGEHPHANRNVKQRSLSEAGMRRSPSDNRGSRKFSWGGPSDGSASPSRIMPTFGEHLWSNKSEIESEPTVEKNDSTKMYNMRQNSLASLDGVLFPVTSKDAIAGFLDDKDSFRSPMRMASYANEEWPDFK
ncbi:hypothetical protein ACHAWF_006701 [Thalassiosira exigua]